MRRPFRQHDLGTLGDHEAWIDQILLFRVWSSKYDEGHSAVRRFSTRAMTLMHIKSMLVRIGQLAQRQPPRRTMRNNSDHSSSELHWPLIVAWVCCVIPYLLRYALRPAPQVMSPELRTAFGLAALGISPLAALETWLTARDRTKLLPGYGQAHGAA